MATGLLYHRMKPQRAECFCVQRKAMAVEGLRSFHWLGESLVIRQEHASTDNQLLHGWSHYHLWGCSTRRAQSAIETPHHLLLYPVKLSLMATL